MLFSEAVVVYIKLPLDDIDTLQNYDDHVQHQLVVGGEVIICPVLTLSLEKQEHLLDDALKIDPHSLCKAGRLWLCEQPSIKTDRG